MIIKKRFSVLLSLFAITLLLFSCDQKETLYSGEEYVMFSDTLGFFGVTNDEEELFNIEIGSTVARDYDRTFGVEIVDEGSTAIENVHYKLISNNVTIKAGELAAKVEFRGYYDEIESTDSLGFNLRLVAPQNVEWDIYKNSTSVVLLKACPFTVADWIEADGGVNEQGEKFGNFILLYTFPTPNNTITKRLIEGYKVDDDRISFHNFLQDEFNITMRFEADNLWSPTITVLPQEIFLDNSYGAVKVQSTPSVASLYSPCSKVIFTNLDVYVDGYGSFGSYNYILQWIPENEAAIIREYGFN